MKYRDLILHEPSVAKCPGHDKKEGMPCKNPKLYKKPPLRFLLWLKYPEQYPAGGRATVEILRYRPEKGMKNEQSRTIHFL